MKIQVTRDEFAKLCARCAKISAPHGNCEECVMWDLCEGKGIHEFVTDVVMPPGKDGPVMRTGTGTVIC